MAAFHRLGQRPLAVKVMRNKFTGEPAGYAFVHFQNDEEAIDTMHKLNGKPIPGTFPVVRFRLNTASREARANMQQEREFSVWVGDLSPDVDDYSLYRVFASKYSSIKTAKDTTCRDWFRRFKKNDFELEDKERSGKQKKFEDEKLEELLDQDVCQTLTELRKTLQVDELTVSKV
ncbi:tRNA selenocysteine 1-associated protein 1 [Eumeta japonica]|uniref:tRNA selenocysteine-associated protein 1 n=1 Tax=Eumeta variegata TaxID=151549 RepID=A0A4C1XPG8_EUMVA|nr:tRNA selenocysteine 1-associated protein 1 [Eumeta japonica]